jgi:hypothetical protein
MIDDQRQRRIGRTLMLGEEDLLSMEQPDDLLSLILN